MFKMLFSKQPSIAHREFLTEIAPWREAYQAAAVSFFAVRYEGVFYVAQARLDFFTSKAQLPSELRFECQNVRAQRFHLGTAGTDWSDWAQALQQMADGQLSTPDGTLSLYCNGIDYSRSVWTPPDDQWRRDVIFSIDGNQFPGLKNNRALDREVKAASPPYDGLLDLVSEYGLNTQQFGQAYMQATGWHVAEVDMNSAVGETEANLGCFLAHGMPTASFRLNYRIRLSGKTIERATLVGTNMEWEDQALSRRGVGRIEIPKGAVIQCLAIVNGELHHQFWLANPKTLPNPTRAAYERYDPQLAVLRAFLFDAQRRGYDARDMEFGVSWLLWMHGFSPAVFGPSPRMQDGPDLLVTTPAGHFLAVECTIGTLRADNKLSKLHERATGLRRQLNESGHSHVRLLPVIVTMLTREEVRADIEQAERFGILVMTREDLEKAIGESLMLQTADVRFAAAEKAVEDNQKRHIPSINDVGI